MTNASEPTRSERKAYLRVLCSLAWADGELQDSELEVLHLAASDLGVALGERDLDPADLDDLADRITHPQLQARLLDELCKLAGVDDDLDPEELSTIKFFAERYGLTPPALPGVDWDAVAQLDE
jgi:uncharacterized tellurite resistance protein B-like protein